MDRSIAPHSQTVCPKATWRPWRRSHSVGLRPLARSHQHLLYNLLFQTSSAALKALALDSTYLGGQIGMRGVLHTWTRDMSSHPHIHSIMPGGALSPDGATWLTPPMRGGWCP